ncbi:hypothetical protein FOL46_004211 [Perkinsus olseni]|uniref:Uncharacterized protein n=1 Tax=Perkinsus olseni TaxID=32597 RepID=A0A7J6MSX1_PEROL|nr:hypothetical protein FOL46_004211 [Perkinsus olseni]
MPLHRVLLVWLESSSPGPVGGGGRSPCRAPTAASLEAAHLEQYWDGPCRGCGRHDHGHTSGGGDLVIPLPTPCQLCDMNGGSGSPGGGTTAANTPGRSSDEDRQSSAVNRRNIIPRAAREIHKSAPCKASGGYMDANRGVSEDTTAGDSSPSDTSSLDDDIREAALQSPEWANSDPPIHRPESYPTAKLFLPVPIRPPPGFLCNQVLTDTEVPPYGLSPVSVPGEDTPVDEDMVATFDRLRFMAIGISETSGLHVRLHYGDRKLVNANSEKYQVILKSIKEDNDLLNFGT